VFEDPTFDTAKAENWTLEYIPSVIEDHIKFDGTRIFDTKYFPFKIGETQMQYEF
jgi:hypothetical protein